MERSPRLGTPGYKLIGEKKLRSTFMSVKSIWVLEDDLQMQAIYQDMLGRDYHLTFFANLQKFRTGLENSPMPDLMILDLMVPDGSLHTVFEDFAHILKSTPFLIVSGLDEQDAIRNSF